MSKVRYVEGPGPVTIEGVRFRHVGQEQDVPDDVAKELVSGDSERFEGFTFEAVGGSRPVPQGKSTSSPAP